MIWVDQTLGEGLRIGIRAEKIISLGQLLQMIRVEDLDIRVTDWEKYGACIINKLPQKHIRAKVTGTAQQVELAHQLGIKNILLACALNPGGHLPDQVHKALLAAEHYGMKIALSIDNASSFSAEEMLGLWGSVSNFGIRTLVYRDGESLLNPLSTFQILEKLAKSIPVELEFHGHNAYGLATANTLGAIQAGVKRIAIAVAGVGLHGHAALEEVIMVQKSLLGQNMGKTEELSSVCSQMLSAIEVELPATKAIIGQDIFAHESGIHVDGVIKNPQIYEAFSPNEVGLSRKLVIGKHSGTASIQAKFVGWNIKLSIFDAKSILKQVRNLAVKHKKTVDDQVLWKLYQGRVV